MTSRVTFGSLAILMWAVLPATIGYAEDDVIYLNLFTHAEVHISESPESIWPYIVDPSDWKTASKISHYSGTSGEVGEVRKVGGEEGGSGYHFFIETVALDAHKRQVIKLADDQGALMGYAAFTLYAGDSGTLVTYDVYAESTMDEMPEDVTPDQIPAIEAEYMNTNQARFERELVHLKKIVENRNSGLSQGEDEASVDETKNETGLDGS